MAEAERWGPNHWAGPPRPGVDVGGDPTARMMGSPIREIPPRNLASLLLAMWRRPELWNEAEHDTVLSEVVRRLIAAPHG